MNYSLNGYDRDTNPFTTQEGIISFANVHSCGTATAISLPCMFSSMNRNDFNVDDAKNQDGILDVFQRAGISVLWKENDDGCKGVCDRVTNQNRDPAQYPELCHEGVCFDAVLLDGLETQIHNMQGNRLVVLHLIGSHGPTYFRRYPDEHRAFSPDCPRSDIENCSHEELVNTYDNTIRYTDWVLGQLIGKLKSLESRYKVGLIYLSDHGESLGEKGLYLHGTPYAIAPDEQTHVPMLMWFSPEFASSKGLDIKCLTREAKETSFSHDNLFDSLLGIMEVKTSAYRQQQDLFRPCVNDR